MLVSRTVLLRGTFAGHHPALRVMTLRAPESHRLASDKAGLEHGRAGLLAGAGLLACGCPVGFAEPVINQVS